MKSSPINPNRKPCLEELGDFTTTVRVIPICLLAVGIGVVSTFVAWTLLKLIGLITNIAYYHRIDTAFVSPAGNHLGLYAVLVPVVSRGSRPDYGHGLTQGPAPGPDALA